VVRQPEQRPDSARLSNDLRLFLAFIAINQLEEFRAVTRSHIQTWLADLKNTT
jgi:hypothetical protein